MSVKLIWVGDQHFDSVPPASRKDNYLESLQLKVQEIRQLAIDHGVNGVVWLGDLLNRQDGHRVPYFVTNWLIEYFASYPSHISNFLVMGNHDVKANPQNWRRQPVGALVLASVVKPLWADVTDVNPWGAHTYVLTQDDTVVELSGKQFSYEADLPKSRATYYARTRSGGAGNNSTNARGSFGSGGAQSFHIMACHAQIVPVGETCFGHFSTPKDIADSVPPGAEAQLYLCGHLHDFYGSFGYDRIRVVNLGSLARGSIDEFNLRRQVKIGYLEVTGKGPFSAVVEEIVLKSVKPADEVFYRDEITRKKKRVEELDRLADMLNAGTIADEFRIINAGEALEVVLRSKHVRPEVEQLVREKVNSAKAELES